MILLTKQLKKELMGLKGGSQLKVCDSDNHEYEIRSIQFKDDTTIININPK